MAFPTPAPREEFTLILLDALEVELGRYELLNYTGGAYKFNTYPLRRYGSVLQDARGDHTAIIDNLKFLIRGVGHPQAVQQQLYRQLQWVRRVQVGTFWLPVACGAGVNSVDFLTPTDFRAEIEVIPSTIYWTDGTTQQIAVA